MAQPSIDYVPRDPLGSVRHGLVRDHFETFRVEATHLRDGDGLPPRVRYLLAWDHDLCKGVVRVLLREVHRFLRARARERGVRDPHGGGVAIVQRFDGRS